jgi:long-chain fatty acid transport protein
MRLKLIAALAAAAPFFAHATDGYFSHGYGMVAKGMGGASLAVTGSSFGAANNPATMAFTGNTWELGLDMFSPWRSAERSGAPPQAGLNGSADSDSNYFFIPEFGFNRMANPNLSYGLTVYGNGGMNTDYPGGQLPSPGACGPATGPGTGFNPQPGPYNLLCGNGRLGVDLSQLIVAPSVAFKVAPEHSIGIAPLFAYQRFKAEGIQAFQGFSTSPGNMTNQGYDSSTGWGARIGYYGRITPQFAIGAMYTTKMSMSEFDKYKGLFAEAGGFDIPSHYGIGVSFEPSPQMQIALDYERINYSDVKSVNNPSSQLLHCAGGDLSACLGGSNGAGFGWRDIDVWKLGIQYRYDDRLTLRAGYNYSQNPITSADVTINILAPGVVQHHITGGATWALDRDSALTFAAMYAFNNDVTAPSFFNNFAPGLAMQEKIKMYEYSLGVQYQRRF